MGEGDELFAAVGTDPDHDQQAEFVFLQPDVHVDVVRPQVDVVHPRQVPGGEGTLLGLPVLGELGDSVADQALAEPRNWPSAGTKSPVKGRAGRAAAAPR